MGLLPLHLAPGYHTIWTPPICLVVPSQLPRLFVLLSLISKSQGSAFEAPLFSITTHSPGDFIHPHHLSPGPSLSLHLSSNVCSSQASRSGVNTCVRSCLSLPRALPWLQLTQGKGKVLPAAPNLPPPHLLALISHSLSWPPQPPHLRALEWAVCSTWIQSIFCSPLYFIQVFAQISTSPETFPGHLIYNFRASGLTTTYSPLFLIYISFQFLSPSKALYPSMYSLLNCLLVCPPHHIVIAMRAELLFPVHTTFHSVHTSAQ